MPVISVNLQEFVKFVGTDLSITEIAEALPMLGVAWEGYHDGEFSVEVFPNRPDMLSVEGLARAFSSFIGVRPGLRRFEVESPGGRVTRVEGKVSPIRPYIGMAVILDFPMEENALLSMMQLQEKLHITHCRRRRKASIGIYDLDTIVFPITYTTKPVDFRFRPLEWDSKITLRDILLKHPKGIEYAYILEGLDRYPILLDNNGTVLSMPPIINSEDTKVTLNTTNLLIDVTGTHLKTVLEVLNIVTSSIAERGGRIGAVRILYPNKELVTPDMNPRSMVLNIKYATKLLGIDLTVKDVKMHLRKMGYEVEGKGNCDEVEVLIPCYRTDIMHQIDLVEDIAIAYGYGNFEPELPSISTIGEEDDIEKFSHVLRDLMVGFNMQEVITFYLSNEDKLFRRMEVPAEPLVKTANPKTEEYTVLRTWLLPSLMEVLSRNQHNEYPQRIFEVDDVVILDEKTDTGARTERKLAAAVCHADTGFHEIKGLVESFLKNIGIRGYKFEELEKGCFITGRAAKVLVEQDEIGYFGEIHPKVLENWGLKMPVSAMEFSVNKIYRYVKEI
ncbi:phenylalanine--tRNA ligase subunit beta [archaeon]|nr:MAG: phenylalanine--tRNA ligase subunit beta [archaeon]